MAIVSYKKRTAIFGCRKPFLTYSEYCVIYMY